MSKCSSRIGGRVVSELNARGTGSNPSQALMEFENSHHTSVYPPKCKSKLDKKHPGSTNLRQAAILNLYHVTIWFAICHFISVVIWNRASISNGFQDNGPQTYWYTTMTFQGHMTSSITGPFDSAYMPFPFCRCHWYSDPKINVNEQTNEPTNKQTRQIEYIS